MLIYMQVSGLNSIHFLDIVKTLIVLCAFVDSLIIFYCENFVESDSNSICL